MNDFLTSLKADLTGRRLLPAVALVGVLLLAALAYAVLGAGGGSGPAASGSSPSIPSAPRGLAVTATSAEKAVAETPDGVAEQRKGPAHDPFAALPESAAAKAAAAKGAAASASAGASSSAAGSETKSASGGSSKTSGGSAPSNESKPKPAAPKAVYDVALLFGAIPAGATPQTVTLTPYENVKLQTPLPSAKQALLVYRGVTAKGRSAIFSIVGEAILHGGGRCLPEPTQCQAIALQPGQSEQLEYTPLGGQTVVYELRVVSIASAKASAARAAALAAGVKAGGQLLRRAGLVALSFLRYSSQVGVLVYASSHARAVHTARRHGRR